MPLAEFQQAILQECMQQQGCPLCRAVWKIDGTRFDWYVNDGVLDEETRRNVVRSVGFCAPHASYLALIEGNDFLWSHLGSCMVYIHVIEYTLLPDLERMLTRSGNRLLQSLRRQVFSPLRHLFHHDLCPLYFDHRQHEATYREQFVNAFRTSETFRQAYRQADSLCIPHFQRVRSALAEQHLVHLLDMTEMHALQRGSRTSPSGFPRQLKQDLCLLYGGETMLWSDVIPRAAIHATEANPVSCLACQRTAHEIPGLIPAFLDHFLAEAPFEKRGEQGALSVCSWHAWWLYNHSTRQPGICSRLDQVLRITCSGLPHQVGARNMQHRACHICTWLDEQVTLQVENLQRHLGDSRQPVQICLSHARAALALLRSVGHLVKRLEGYVYKCTERFQDQMQPDERVAWLDAIRLFGGSESAQFLLTSSQNQKISG